MDTTTRIASFVRRTKELVFLRREFSRFGSEAQVGRALSVLVARGMLLRIGRGVYVKAKVSVLSGRWIPIQPVDVLAPKALRKLGIAIGPSRLARDYNTGRSTQVPPGVVINVGKRRIVRRLGFNGKYVEYERDAVAFVSGESRFP